MVGGTPDLSSNIPSGPHKQRTLQTFYLRTRKESINIGPHRRKLPVTKPFVSPVALWGLDLQEEQNEHQLSVNYMRLTNKELINVP